jgi:Ca2+-binding EF-hand superfamily protein
VNDIFDKYDANRNGVLEKRETLRMLNEILARQGKPSATLPYFNRIYQDIDLNNDGVISREECALFMMNYLNVPIEIDEDIQIQVMNIFNKYDDNRNGYLEKRETLGLLNELLANRGQQPATLNQFNRFFSDIDVNRDGVVSKLEMTDFIKNFTNQPVVSTAQVEKENIDVMVFKIFDKYDDNGNGYLEKKEALRFLNDLLANRGQQPATFTQFNKFFSEIDDNGDGIISRRECTRFVRKFLGMAPTEQDKVADTIN